MVFDYLTLVWTRWFVHTTSQINKAKRAGFRWEHDQTTTTYEVRVTHAERKNMDEIPPLTCWRLGSGEMCRTIQHWKNDKAHTEKREPIQFILHVTNVHMHEYVYLYMMDEVVILCIFWASQRVKERLRSTSTLIFSIVIDKIDWHEWSWSIEGLHIRFGNVFSLWHQNRTRGILLIFIQCFSRDHVMPDFGGVFKVLFLSLCCQEHQHDPNLSMAISLGGRTLHEFTFLLFATCLLPSTLACK